MTCASDPAPQHYCLNCMFQETYNSPFQSKVIENSAEEEGFQKPMFLTESTFKATLGLEFQKGWMSG